MAEFHDFAGPAELAEFAADRVSAGLARGLAERGAASLVVPGGRTPAAFLSKLGRKPLDWRHISVTLCDERWVPEQSPYSNAAMLRSTLLEAADAEFIPLYNFAASPEQAVADIEARLAPLPRPWDAVVLGMGDDGHFASLFPGESALVEGLDLRSPHLCVAAGGPAGGPRRLSLTLACLARARRITLLATGAHKRAVWEEAASADPHVLPVAALHALRTPPVDFLWCP
jgi:6-phosphogluconolactonase